MSRLLKIVYIIVAMLLPWGFAKEPMHPGVAPPLSYTPTASLEASELLDEAALVYCYDAESSSTTAKHDRHNSPLPVAPDHEFTPRSRMYGRDLAEHLLPKRPSYALSDERKASLDILIKNAKLSYTDTHSFAGHGLTPPDLLYIMNTLASNKPADIISLDFSDNQITEINAAMFSPKFTNLALINLSHNLLSSIERYVFLGCSALRSIDLSYNQLSYIESHTFNAYRHLISVNLDHNHIHSLDPKAFVGAPIFSLNLSHNHLRHVPDGCFNPLQAQLQDLIRSHSLEHCAKQLPNANPSNLMKRDRSMVRLLQASNLLPEGSPGFPLKIYLQHNYIPKESAYLGYVQCLGTDDIEKMAPVLPENPYPDQRGIILYPQNPPDSLPPPVDFARSRQPLSWWQRFKRAFCMS